MSNATKTKMVNLGCGKYPLPGYVNVDLHEPADVQGDVWDLNFDDVEAVRMDHFLEHFSHRVTLQLLMRVRSWMKPGGMLQVEVPDMDTIMGGGYKDWLRYVYGSQQHEGEFHRSGFTTESLYAVLKDAGFTEIKTACFESEFKTRRGMPVLQAVARA
jgi:predicted SAM-dependent methyltransferase